MAGILIRVFKLAGKEKKNLILAFIFNFLESTCMMIPLYFMLLTLTDITQNTLTMDTTLNRVLYMLTALLAQYIFNLLVHFFQSGTGIRMMNKQRVKMGDKLKTMPMGCFSDNRIGDVTAVLTNDLTFVETFSMQFLSKVINALISTILIILFLLSISWKMTIVAIIVYPIVFLLNIKIQKDFKKYGEQRQEKQSEVVSALLEYIQGISVIKALNLSGKKFNKLDSILAKFEKTALNFEMKAIPLNTVFMCCFQVSIGLILYFAPQLYLSKDISLPIVMMFIIIAFRIYAPVEALSIYSGIIRLMDTCLNRLESIMSIKPLDDNDKDEKASRFDIEFKNVCFHYERKQVLKNVSFKSNENSMTAIVGPSGSGKTTISNLIARFWDVQEGEVLIGGINVKNMKCDTVLSNISMIFQNVYLFNDTILNNIKLGKPDATIDQVIEAAQKARCHGFISELENGYDTIIAEGGSTLSGGEKQRISIARAILKDAPIIVVDEATSNVDPENEKELQDALNALVKEKTLIVIAHRLSTVKKANQILVLNKEGVLVEKGTHFELIENNGMYSDFWSKRLKARDWNVYGIVKVHKTAAKSTELL